MFFESWQDFLQMGGYGFYVWLSYGISFAAIVILAIQSYRDKSAVLREVRREQAREQRVQNKQRKEGL
jgi:heme exporter protein CcmD